MIYYDSLRYIIIYDKNTIIYYDSLKYIMIHYNIWHIKIYYDISYYDIITTMIDLIDYDSVCTCSLSKLGLFCFLVCSCKLMDFGK